MTIEKQKTDARQGNTNKTNARVLTVSLGLAAVVVILAALVFAL
ncbi:hypothetical protein [Stappia stellulata]|nr:hypothetical protein [Stappia stellulata]